MNKIILLFAIGFGAQSWAGDPNIEEGKLDLKRLSRCIATPAFAVALAEATGPDHAKIRMDYKIDKTSRTTSETVQVTVVGRSGEAYSKSEFTSQGINGCWSVHVSEVNRTSIPKTDFIDFEE